MTKAVYQSMFVFLSTLLLALLFVVQPTDNAELKKFQTEIKDKFALAAQQVIGDESFSEPFALVWATTQDFYSQSADEALALLTPDESFTDLALSFNKEYWSNLAYAAQPVTIVRAQIEEPIYNIVPMSENEKLLDPYFNEDQAYLDNNNGGKVAGESISVDQPQSIQPEVNTTPVVWMTVNDSITGYPYCVGIFDGEINSYPGACATEHESSPIYQN